MPPPTDPGIQDRNSISPILFSFAYSDKFFWGVAQPATIKFSFNIEIFEKFFPSLIITPGKVASLIKTKTTDKEEYESEIEPFIVHINDLGDKIEEDFGDSTIFSDTTSSFFHSIFLVMLSYTT